MAQGVDRKSRGDQAVDVSSHMIGKAFLFDPSPYLVGMSAVPQVLHVSRHGRIDPRQDRPSMDEINVVGLPASWAGSFLNLSGLVYE